jgi:hypothetical protein
MTTNNATGKIYKLICSDGRFYVGYTQKSLEERLTKHIQKSREKREKGRKLYKHISNIGGWENVVIELLHTLENKTKQEIMIIESKIIEENFLEMGCLNSGRSFITL